jgi:hypothetical protein
VLHDYEKGAGEKENSENDLTKKQQNKSLLFYKLGILPCFSLLIIDFRESNGLDEIDYCLRPLAVFAHKIVLNTN